VRRHDGPQVITIPLREFVTESDKPLHTVTFVADEPDTETLAKKLKWKLREVALLTAIVGLMMGAIIYRVFFW
jgi:hypothetical protein